MIDITLFTTLISPLITISCLVLGYILKNAVKTDKINPFIPLILGATGIICNIWSLGAFSFDIVLSGAVSGLAATGLYEAFKNMIEKNL